MRHDQVRNILVWSAVARHGSVSRAAKAAGIDPREAQYFARGDRYLRSDKLLKLADTCGMELRQRRGDHPPKQEPRR